MLSRRYLSSVKNIPAVMQKIREGTAPERFTMAHLKGLGFTSSNDQPILGLLKDLGFLTAEGAPTPRYHAYRDPSRSRSVMAEALREAYGDLFHINEKLGPADREAVRGKFKSTHNVTDRVADEQTATFYALLGLADMGVPQSSGVKMTEQLEPSRPESAPEHSHKQRQREHVSGLHYNIQIHLPATKDVEVFNAIFKSLKEHLID